MTIDAILEAILAREGGWTDHPADSGGMTNWGITLDALGQWKAGRATEAELRALTREQAKTILLGMYVESPKLDKIHDADLRAFIVDAAVNHGPRTAVRWLQRRLGVKADGLIGPVTLAALAAADVRKLRAEVIADRVRYYGTIISKNPTQAVFAAGWANRVAEFVEGLA